MSPQYTLQSQDVYHFPINTLDTLPLSMPGVMQSRDLLRVLVFAAASRLSVHHAGQQRARAPSAPTVLGTLAGQLSDLDALEGHVNELLAKRIPKGLGKRGRRVALDLLELPDHGTVEETHHDEVCRGKAKQGPPHFCTDATASAIVRGQRDTVARCRVRATRTMAPVLERLPKRLAALASKARVLLLERGFYRVKGMRALLDREQPCSMPASKRGQTPAQAGGPTGTSVMAQWTCRDWPS